MSTQKTPTTTASRPELPQSKAGRRALVVFGLLSLIKALGWILIAQSIAEAITPFAVNPTSADTPSLIALLTPQVEPFGSLPPSANLGFALALGLCGAGLRALAAWGIEVVANRVALGEKERFRRQILRYRLTVTGSERVGEDAVLMTRGLDGMDDYYKKYWPAVISSIILPLAFGLWILWHDWVSAAVLVLTIPLIPLFMILIGKHTEERVEAAADGLSRISQHLYELARGLPVLVGLRRADTHSKALRTASTEYRKTTMETLRTAFMSSLALELIATLSVAVIAVFIGVRLVYGQMELFDGLVVLVLAAEVYLPFREVGAAFHSSEDGLESLRRVRQELSRPHPGTVSTKDTAVLDVKSLSLQYDGASSSILNQAQFCVQAGQLVVLGSASGSGKSTLLKALAGVPQPDLIVTISKELMVPNSRLYLSQHPGFTEQTVSEELRLYASGITADSKLSEKVLGYCSATHLQQRVVAELSPGEQRRVALARVLYRGLIMLRQQKSVVLFLDEPTAHLDNDSAELIRSGLVLIREQYPQLGMLVASHDSEIHEMADVVLDIDHHGKLSPRPTQWSTQKVDQPSAVQQPSSEEQQTPAESFTAENSAASLINTEKVPLRTLLSFLPLKEPRFAAGVAMAVVTVLSASALAALSGWLIVQASYQPPVLFLLAIIVGVRFFGIGRAVSRYTERLITHRAILDWATNLRMKIWSNLATNIKFWPVLTRRGGSLKFLISDVDEIRDSIPRVVVPIPAAILSWLLTTVLLGLILPAVVPVVVTAGMIGLVVLPSIIFVLAKRTQHKIVKHRGWLMEETSLLLAASPELKANGLSTYALERFSAEENKQAQELKANAFSAGIGQAGANLMSAAAAVFAVVAALQAGLEAPMTALIGFMLLSLAEPFGQMAEATQEAGGLLSRLRALAPLMEDHDEVAGDAITLAQVPTTQPREVLGLQAEALTVQYPNSTQPVFTDLDFQVRQGELTMITGDSGSGKSTLLAVLLGFLPQIQGQYRIEVATDTAISIEQALGRIAWCPQEAYLFNSTVEGNLALAREKENPVTHEQMHQALEMVGLKPWLDQLPQGLSTKIGGGGSHLSGGQRQRLALARALLTKADIVLLDEPTAHLGEDEAAELVHDLQRLKNQAGVVMVTHQLDYLPYADNIVRLGSIESKTAQF